MGELNNIFNQFLENKPIFDNREALTISFTPENIPYRNTQIADLGRILAPALKGAKTSNVFIYGRCGTGKTLVAQYVGRELEEVSKKNGVNVKIVYVNCKMKKSADTEYRLLAGLIKKFGKDVPFTGLPTDQLYHLFFDAIEGNDNNVILIIDEVDALVQKAGDEILYNLTRMNQDLKKSKVSIIGITNDLGFIDKLDPRIKSSLNEEELIFPPYNAVQIQEILRDRSKLAFVPDVLEQGVIEKCSALAAQEHGDARKALDLLRVSAELAERESSGKVSIKFVDKAEDKIDLDRTVEIVKTQPRQSQAVLWGIIKAIDETEGDIEGSDVIEQYEKLCKGHGLKPLTQRRVSDLIAELDMFGVITSKVLSKGRYGRTRVISLDVSDKVLENIKGILSEVFY